MFYECLHTTVCSFLFCYFHTEELRESFDVYIASTQKQHPGLKILRVRHDKQRGLAQARVSGWNASSADVVAILDAHIEVNVEW